MLYIWSSQQQGALFSLFQARLYTESSSRSTCKCSGRGLWFAKQDNKAWLNQVFVEWSGMRMLCHAVPFPMEYVC